jgi:hypothetical protein
VGRRRRKRGLPQTRQPLFVTIARGYATPLSIASIKKLSHVARGKAILKHISRRSKLYSTNMNVFRGRRTRILPQSNKKMKGIWRGGLSQVVHKTMPVNFSTTAI